MILAILFFYFGAFNLSILLLVVFRGRKGKIQCALPLQMMAVKSQRLG